MPFVTEALWAALPHRAVGPGAAHRRALARGGGAGSRRRGRARGADRPGRRRSGTPARRARLPAGDRLETWVYVPIDARRGLRVPATGASSGWRGRGRSIASSRPRRSTRLVTPGDLAVIVPGGDLEAAIRPAAPDADAAALERSRLERELEEAETRLAAARDRLSNEAFLAKAPPAVVEGARALETELTEQVERLRDRLGG